MQWFELHINDLRVIVTVLSLMTFGGIVAWAMSRRNKSRFDEAAMLPFAADSRFNQVSTPADPRQGTSDE